MTKIKCDFCQEPATRLASSGRPEQRRVACDSHRLLALEGAPRLAPRGFDATVGLYDDVLDELNRRNGRRADRQNV